MSLNTPHEKPSLQDSLFQIINFLDLSAKEEIVRFITRNPCASFADLNCLLNASDRPAELNEELLERLQRHAELLPLSRDLAVNEKLIARGYINGLAIANTTINQFVSKTYDILGELKAVKIYAKARSQMHFLDSKVIDLIRNHDSDFDKIVASYGLTTDSCQCEDCLSAVSPLSYLADLLDYAETNLRLLPSASAAELAKRFHQPFEALPNSCESVSAQIRQVRICIEVLRDYLPPDISKTSAALAKAEADYRRNAYLSFLLRLGTSYDEIRLARVAKPEARAALAERLGIPLSAVRPDELDTLFVDASQITEDKLQTLFGLRKTVRDLRTKLADSTLLSWREQLLRVGWFSHDWPHEEYLEDPRGLPVIEPDLLVADMVIDGNKVPADIRQPTAGNLAYDLLRKRQEWVRVSQEGLKSDREANNLAFILNKVFGSPLPDFDIYYQNIQLGRDIDETKKKLSELGMTVDAFLFLMSIKDKVAIPKPIDLTDWDELYAILTQSLKYKKYAEWRAEESAKTLTLSPRYFLVSLEEPALFKKWLGDTELRKQWQQALRLRSQVPLINPDLLEEFDLGLPTATNPAYALWAYRRKWIKDAYNAIAKDTNKKLIALDNLIASIFATGGIDAVELEKLVSSFNKGIRINAQLERLGISIDALAYLVRARSILVSGATLLDSEWAELFSILTQVQKQREYADWRDMEKDKGISLSPQFFQIPPPPPPSIPPVSTQPLDRPVLDPWRAAWRELKSFQDKLQARIDQQNGIAEGLSAAVDAVEEGTLPALRDALTLATGKGSGLSACAKWVEQNLLIDAQMGGGEKTTRVAQAITTVQGLFFTARNGLLLNVHKDLKLLDIAAFDQNWKWLGSYATWRAAMFVFMYPENILLPNLREYQTPAFHNLVSELRSRRQLSPEQACQAAKNYYAYLTDIATIRVKRGPNNAQVPRVSATCKALTSIHSGKCYDRTPALEKNLVYMFGIGGETTYFSTYDDTIYTPPESAPERRQSYWEAVPGIAGDIIGLIGAVTYELPSKDQYVFIFAQQINKGRPALVFTRFNTKTRNWDQQPTTLDLPDGIKTWRGILKQSSIRSRQPHVIVQSKDTGIVFDRELNPDGTDWDKQDWHVLIDSITAHGRIVHAVTEIERTGEDLYIVTTKDQKIEYTYCPKFAVPLCRFINPLTGGLRGEYYTFDAKATEPGSPEQAENKYFLKNNLKLVRIDPAIDFDWFDGSPDPSIPSDGFAVRWTGQFIAPESGDYQFWAFTDDGVRIWHNNEVMADGWGDHGAGFATPKATYPLTRGSHFEIKIEYYENAGDAVCHAGYLLNGDPSLTLFGLWNTTTEFVAQFTTDVEVFEKAVEDRLNSDGRTVIGYLSPQKTNQFNIPLYHYKTKSGADLLIPEDELAQKTGGTGYESLGIVGYMASGPGPGTVPLIRLKSSGGDRYYYSTDEQDALKIERDYNYENQDKKGYFGYVCAKFHHNFKGDGLLGKYFSDLNLGKLAFDRVDATIGGEWGTGSPDPRVGPDNFSIQWTGYIQPWITGEYQLWTRSDDGVRLWIDGKLLIDNWTDHGATDNYAYHTFVAGNLHTIRLDYFEHLGGTILSLKWRNAFFNWTEISTNQLFSRSINDGISDYIGLIIDSNKNDAYAIFSTWNDKIYVKLTPDNPLLHTAPLVIAPDAPFPNAIAQNCSSAGPYLAMWDDGTVGVSFFDGIKRKSNASVLPFLDPQTDYTRDPGHNPITGADLLRAATKAYLEKPQNQGVPARDYIEEAFYHVPMILGLQLQQRQEFTAALEWFGRVYDYSAPPENPADPKDPKARKRYYGLILEEKSSKAYSRSNDWLIKLTYPHNIAKTRYNCYTRYTSFSLTRCLLNFADQEFTQDTSESLPRAISLYRMALDLIAELEPEYKCDDLVRSLGRFDLNPYALQQVQLALAGAEQHGLLSQAVEKIADALVKPQRASLSELRDLAAKAHPPARSAPTLEESRATQRQLRAAAHRYLLLDPETAATTESIGLAAAADMSRALAVAVAPGQADVDLEHAELGWLWQDQAVDGTAPYLRMSLAHAEWGLPLTVKFCIPPNPILDSLLLRGELNLFKLRNGLDIAGNPRRVDPYAAPTDTKTGMPTVDANGQVVIQAATRLLPTPYRYSVLIERAKQLVAQAQQVESQLLSALEKRDAENYNRLRAKQDMRVATANLRLQDLRVKESETGVTIAELQRDRAQLQQDHYQGLLDEGISALETVSLELMGTAAALQILGGIATLSAAGAVSGLAQATTTIASVTTTLASYERRQQEWSFQLVLSQQDVRIGTEQIQQARDHVAVTTQEREVSAMQAQNAEAVVDFLSNKFTNAELYDWMSGILEGVYNSLLQQTTAVARLAAAQLSFERQESMQSFIQIDYWDAPNEATQVSPGADGGDAVDRHGLTGSARLLQDIYKLDQYAFEKGQRKLNLVKTLSLASHDPFVFQRFRETGELSVRTTTTMFDRDFPGHYLRMVKRVRVSVIALIPPDQGVKASLTCDRRSTLVLKVDDLFQPTPVDRGPDYVALTSARDASGVFELDSQSDMLLPFEGIGVDTTWYLRMPKAANPFDYRSVADVTLTIEYTALHSAQLYSEVSSKLNRERLSVDRGYSFRYQLADLWFELNNPDQSANPFEVIWKSRPEDFQANLTDLQIQQVLLYFVRPGGAKFELDVTYLYLFPANDNNRYGSAARTLDGVVSTRKGNGSRWLSEFGGLTPIGTWKLKLPDTPALRDHFKSGEIGDLLFVITYSGTLPQWP